MKYILLLLLIVSCSTTQHQNATPKTLLSIQTISILSEPLTESSGLTAIRDVLYTHNDSGNSPAIYKMDTLGQIRQVIPMPRLQNTDWEAITHDKEHLFVGDFGNNLGNRKDLVIYKILMEPSNNAMSSYEKLELRYASQTNFTPRYQQHSYDLEAMIAIKDSIYLFSKDWQMGQTRIYVLNKRAGVHNLTARDSLPVRCLITDATYNGTNRVVLTGYDRGLQPYIILLELENNTFVFKERIALPVASSQIEAITYHETRDGIETYYLSSEAVNIKLGEEEAKSDGAFYVLKLREQL